MALKFERREELTGLRGLAVVAVVLFHVGVPWLMSGYLGVDVFFLLSGFLITSLLFIEHANTKTINLTYFYARRVRRLLPASATCLLLTAIVYRYVASLMVVRDSMTSFVAGASYVSNWQFIAQDADYWAEGILVSPVKHYWSLSVEEQYYYIFPLLLSVLLRFTQSPVAIKAIFFVISLCSLAFGSSLFLDGRITASYMNTFARMYQLIGGGLLALFLKEKVADKPLIVSSDRGTGVRWRPDLAEAGLAALCLLLVSSSFMTKPVSSFFGGSLSTFCTSLLIYGLERNRASGVSSPAHMILTNRTLVWLGDASFSIYLWHFPFLVIGDYMEMLPAGKLWKAVVVLTGSVMLGACSRYAIEQPVSRVSLSNPVRRRLVASLAIVIGVAVSLSLAVLMSPSLPSGIVRDHVDMDDIAFTFKGKELGGHGERQDAAPYRDGLVDQDGQRYMDGSEEQEDTLTSRDRSESEAEAEATAEAEVADWLVNLDLGAKEPKTWPLKVVAIGDSHCNRAAKMLRALSNFMDFRLHTSCISSTGAVTIYPNKQDAAREAWLEELPVVMAKGTVDVLIVFNFSVQLMCRFDDPTCLGTNTKVTYRDYGEEDTAMLVEGVTSFFNQYVFPHSPKQVAIVLPPPFPPMSMKHCISAFDQDSCAYTLAHHSGYAATLAAYVNVMRLHPEVKLVNFDDIMCPDGMCHPIIDMDLVIDDRHHVSENFWLSHTSDFANGLLDAGISLSR